MQKWSRKFWKCIDCGLWVSLVPLKAGHHIVGLSELGDVELAAPDQGAAMQLCVLKPSICCSPQCTSAGCDKLLKTNGRGDSDSCSNSRGAHYHLVAYFHDTVASFHSWCTAVVQRAAGCGWLCWNPEFVWWAERVGGVSRVQGERRCVMEQPRIVSSITWRPPLFSFSISTVENSFEGR